MPPYIPVVAISRSQNIRIGNAMLGALGNHKVRQFGTYGTAQLGTAPVPTYVDLGDPTSRRDLQHHSALGAVLVVGSLTASSSDFIVDDGASGVVSAGTGNSLSATAGTLKQRSTDVRVSFPSATSVATAPPGTAGQEITYLLVVSTTGGIAPVAVAGVAAPTGTSVAPAAPANTVPLATAVEVNAASAPASITDVRPRS